MRRSSHAGPINTSSNESHPSSPPSCGPSRNSTPSCSSCGTPTRGYPASSSCSRYASPPTSWCGRLLWRRRRACGILELARRLGAWWVLNKGGVCREERSIDILHTRSAAVGQIRGWIERGVILRALERVRNRGLQQSLSAEFMLKCGPAERPKRRTSGKSTQKAFMFMPYKNPAKLSLNRARLSCISCSCTKFCSKSAIASLSSANPSCRPSSALEVEALRERCALSRRELREDGRRGVVGRERGERERRRWEREEGGSWVGVVDAIAPCRAYSKFRRAADGDSNSVGVQISAGSGFGFTCSSVATVAWACTKSWCCVWEINPGRGVVYEARKYPAGVVASALKRHHSTMTPCPPSLVLLLVPPSSELRAVAYVVEQLTVPTRPKL